MKSELKLRLVVDDGRHAVQGPATSHKLHERKEIFLEQLDVRNVQYHAEAKCQRTDDQIKMVRNETEDT